MSRQVALVDQSEIDADFAMRGSLSPVVDDGRHMLPPLDRRGASSRAAASRTQKSYFTSDQRTTSSSGGQLTGGVATTTHTDSDDESKGRYATDGRAVVVDDVDGLGTGGGGGSDSDSGDNMVSEFKPVISSPPVSSISAVRQALRIKRHERLQAQAQAQGAQGSTPSIHATATATGTGGLGSASTGTLGHGSPAFSPLVSLPASVAAADMSMTPLYMSTRTLPHDGGDARDVAAAVSPLHSPTHGVAAWTSHTQAQTAAHTSGQLSHTSSAPAGMHTGSTVPASPGRASVDSTVKGSVPLGQGGAAHTSLHRSATERAMSTHTALPKKSFSFMGSALASTGHGGSQAGRPALPTVSETGKWQETEHEEPAGDRRVSDAPPSALAHAAGYEKERERQHPRLTSAVSSPQLILQKSHASFSGVYETLSQMLGRKQAEVQARRQAEVVAEGPVPSTSVSTHPPKGTTSSTSSSVVLAGSATASHAASGETTPARRSSASSVQHAGVPESRPSTAPASPLRPFDSLHGQGQGQGQGQSEGGHRLHQASNASTRQLALPPVPEETSRGTVSGSLFFEQVSRAALASHAAEAPPAAAYPAEHSQADAHYSNEQADELQDAQNRSTELSQSAESTLRPASAMTGSSKGARGVRLLATTAGAKGTPRGKPIVAALVKEDSGISGRLQVQADGALRVFSQPVASARFASPKVNTWRGSVGAGKEAESGQEGGKQKAWELTLHDSHWDEVQPQLSGPSLSSLSSLSLISCHLTVDHLQLLPTLPGLKALDLSDNDLSGLGVYVLNGVPMDDEALMRVMTWASFAPRLQSLRMRGCLLTTVPGLYTRQGVGLPLQLLDLSCNGIRSLEGIEAVGSTLAVLDVSVNEISAVRDCRSLSSCKALQRVLLDPNPLTLSKGASELRTAMKTIVPHLLSLDGQSTGHGLSSPARPGGASRRPAGGMSSTGAGTGTGVGAGVGTGTPKRAYGAVLQSPTAAEPAQDTIVSSNGILYRSKVQRGPPGPETQAFSSVRARSGHGVVGHATLGQQQYEDEETFAAHWPRFPYAKRRQSASAETEAKVAASWGPVEASRVFQSLLRDPAALATPAHAHAHGRGHAAARGYTVPRSTVAEAMDAAPVPLSPVTASISSSSIIGEDREWDREVSPLEWLDMSRTKCLTLLAALKGMAALKPWVELAEGADGPSTALHVQQQVTSILTTLLHVGLLHDGELGRLLKGAEGGGIQPTMAVPSAALVHAAAELLEQEAESLFSCISTEKSPQAEGTPVSAELQADMVRRAGEWMTARSACLLYADILLGLAHACTDGSLLPHAGEVPTSVTSFAVALDRSTVAHLCAGLKRSMTS